MPCQTLRRHQTSAVVFLFLSKLNTCCRQWSPQQLPKWLKFLFFKTKKQSFGCERRVRNSSCQNKLQNDLSLLRHTNRCQLSAQVGWHQGSQYQHDSSHECGKKMMPKEALILLFLNSWWVWVPYFCLNLHHRHLSNVTYCISQCQGAWKDTLWKDWKCPGFNMLSLSF